MVPAGYPPRRRSQVSQLGVGAMGEERGGDSIEIRPYDDADEDRVLEMLATALGWLPDALHRDFFRWKHHENPFGRSPAWLALDGEAVAGFRTFLRWRFDRDGETVSAVRAVDTATHPDYRGRGIFSRLTLHAVERVREEGVAFVFNTPNEQSLPGYLKMGWQEVRRIPVLVRPRSLWSLLRTARARTPAERWGEETSAGEPAAVVLSEHARLAALLASQPPGEGVRTDRGPEYLAWRYGFEPLNYRVLLAGSSVDDGLLVFRLRRRGPAVEAVVDDVIVPEADRRVARRLLSAATRRTGADHAVRFTEPSLPRAGYLPLPGQGPTLVWREVTETEPPPAEAWNLSLGDVELF